MKSDYLAGWKEIAEYLGRGIRTVQRWEAQFDMPVRRPAGRSHSAVMARREELDQWAFVSDHGQSAGTSKRNCGLI